MRFTSSHQMVDFQLISRSPKLCTELKSGRDSWLRFGGFSGWAVTSMVGCRRSSGEARRSAMETEDTAERRWGGAVGAR